MTALFDPRLFNLIIMALYSLNVIWWLFHGKPWDSLYWFAAFLITFTVTFGYRH